MVVAQLNSIVEVLLLCSMLVLIYGVNSIRRMCSRRLSFRVFVVPCPFVVLLNIHLFVWHGFVPFVTPCRVHVVDHIKHDKSHLACFVVFIHALAERFCPNTWAQGIILVSRPYRFPPPTTAFSCSYSTFTPVFAKILLSILSLNYYPLLSSSIIYGHLKKGNHSWIFCILKKFSNWFYWWLLNVFERLLKLNLI